jgi:hypothetical protein
VSQLGERNSRTRGWYTVSVDTLRTLGVLALLVVLAAAGWIGYRKWEGAQLAREAELLLEEVASLTERAREGRPIDSFSEELGEAMASRDAARQSFERADYRASVEHGRRARALLLALLDVGGQRAAGGEAQFIAVEGDVEFRRGEQGEWQPARSRDVLRSGDYVKTSGGGSAEIVFLDGTLYTVRPNTLFLVTRTRAFVGLGTEQAISMEYGWVDLNTAQRGGRVSTPSAEARVARDSEAAVAVDPATSVARFSAFRGSVEVATADGATKSIGPLEEIAQKGGLLTDPRALPAAPAVLEPAPHIETSLDAARRLVLSWEPVPGAPKYALQVSRNRLFVDNLIDVDSRTKTVATLELRGEGSFQWRVAAVSRDGLQGPWSEARSFRVAAGLRPGERGDTTPPPIEIDQVQVYGNVFIVSGRTEPGAKLRVNGEIASVAQNGAFTKTLVVPREGWSVIELVAADLSGNLATRRQRVFVETL